MRYISPLLLKLRDVTPPWHICCRPCRQKSESNRASSSANLFRSSSSLSCSGPCGLDLWCYNMLGRASIILWDNGFMGCLCWLKVSGLAWDARNLLDSGSNPLLEHLFRNPSCFFLCRLRGSTTNNRSWFSLDSLAFFLKLRILMQPDDGLLKIETKSDQIWLIPWHHNKNNLLLGANLQWSLAASY